MRRSKITTEEIVRDFVKIHGEKYNYSLVSYKTMHVKVKVSCYNHGIFEITPKMHILRKQGCAKCAFEAQKRRTTDTTENFILKATKIHSTKYDYSKTIYGENAHQPISIICKEHGDFISTPNRHLSAKGGCPVCANKGGWTRTSWKKICEGKVAKLYLIKCYNESEEFYKIGITSKEDIGQRFNSKRLMPYSFTVLKIIESEDSDYIFDLEKAMHIVHKRFNYKPKIYFEGSTECFTTFLPILYAEAH